eukprot:TRINITY_DN7950_c0_g1_i1.p1 TRINITY_DN7950_c0_g1~~TRINITY_DN7950_c0_g1_i1.p1  ORF type:complete len:483 (-),score=39.91 TRINITY_DN7950_c0_g1_i1:118-1566(-)
MIDELDTPTHTEQNEKPESTLKRGFIELKYIIQIALPLVGANLFLILLSSITFAFVGRISSIALSAASLAHVLFNLTGCAIGAGILTAFDTLGSQAYGAKNYKAIGLLLQQSFLIMGLLTFPIVTLWIFSDRIFILLHQPVDVSIVASKYIRILIFGIYPFYGFEALKRYLQCQSLVLPIMYVAIAVSVIYPGILYLLIFTFDMGISGAALGFSISFWFLFIFLSAYIFLRKLHVKTWGGFTWKAFSGWKKFFGLGIPGAVMVLAEWAGNEIYTIYAGWINTPTLAAHTIIFNTSVLLYMFGYGVSAGTSVRVGNLLGAGDYKRAKLSATVPIVSIMLFQFVVTITLFNFRTEWISLYTSDPIVIDIASRVLFVYCITMVPDSIQSVCAGVLNGCGRQMVGATLYLFCLYMVGMPIAGTLAFLEDWGLMGLWVGIAIAIWCICLSFLIVVFLTTDWRKWSLLASDRMKETSPESMPLIEIEG